MKIVDSQKEFELFLVEFEKADSLIIPIYTTDYKHPKLDSISLIWIHLVQPDVDYILTVDHSEMLFSIDPALLFNCLKDKDNKLYTLNKKDLLYSTNNVNLNIIDLELIEYFDAGTKTIFPTCKIQQYFKYKYPKYKINTLVPLVSWIEYFNLIKPALLNLLATYNHLDRAYNFYNDFIIPGLYNIESRGIRVNMGSLSKSIDKNVNIDIEKGLMYTQYNIYTTTGRPSNRFNSINFVALNKETGIRDIFISRFEKGGLVEFDFESYHLRIIGNLIGYKFPKSSVHEYLGKLYYNKEILTPEELDAAKKLNFKHVYGGITKEYIHIEFFKKVQTYTAKLWKAWNTYGYIESPVSNRKLYKKNYPQLNSQKLFNYLIQLLEIELNISKMERIDKYLEQFDTKLVLYIYDAFLFDFNFADGKKCLTGIKNILEDGNYIVRKYAGANYGNLRKF